jgi:hypothetical protein
MLRSRLGLKVLGLCALVLGLAALSAGGAQAASWSIIMAKGELVKVNETNKLFAQVEINAIENNTLTLAFQTAGGTKVAILCTSMGFDEGGRLMANGVLSLGRTLFKGCLTKLNGVTSAACKPKAGGAPSGEILPERFTGIASVSSETLRLRITPENAKGETSKLFLKIELGVECSIGEIVNVEANSLGGGLLLEANALKEEEKVEQLVVEVESLIALGQPAKVEGSIWMRLVGEHLGLKWGGIPG